MKRSHCVVLVITSLFVGGLATYTTVGRLESERATASFHQALKSYEDNDLDLSAALLNDSIAHDTNNYAPFYLLGEVYAKKGNSMLAVKMYEEAQKRLDSEDERRSIDAVSIDQKIKALRDRKPEQPQR